MALDSAEKLTDLLVLKGCDLWLGALGQDRERGGVDPDVTDAKSLLKRTMQNAMDILHGLWIKGTAFVLTALQVIDELLDVYRCQLLELFAPQSGLDGCGW